MTNIKDKRISLGITQEYIARKLNISLKHYQNIEYKKTIPNIILGIEIAKILESQPSELWIPKKT